MARIFRLWLCSPHGEQRIRSPVCFTTLPGLAGAFDRKVALAEADADLLEERRRRLSTGKNPHEIVWQGLACAIDVQYHAVWKKLHGIGIEKYFELAFRQCCFGVSRSMTAEAGNQKASSGSWNCT